MGYIVPSEHSVSDTHENFEMLFLILIKVPRNFRFMSQPL